MNMTDKELVDQTVEQMWKDFWRDANPNRPGRKVRDEVQVAYYAGCHTMLAKMMALLRLGDRPQSEFRSLFQKWGDEMEKFVNDYNAGSVEHYSGRKSN
jgi:hypothetical protein